MNNDDRAKLEALPAFDDPHVQIIYRILCDTDLVPPPDEHWEGFTARHVVAALASAQAASAEPINDGPEFTDMGRSALLWVLWHHQGGSSPVGQPLRFALGMGAHDRMSDEQVAAAREWGALQDLAPGSCRECTTPAPAVAPAAVTEPMRLAAWSAGRTGSCSMPSVSRERGMCA